MRTGGETKRLKNADVVNTEKPRNRRNLRNQKKKGLRELCFLERPGFLCVIKLRSWHLCVSPERRSLTERCWKKCATEFSVFSSPESIPMPIMHQSPFIFDNYITTKKTGPKSQKNKGRHGHILACPFSCAKTITVTRSCTDLGTRSTRDYKEPQVG